eukprot:1150130-Pelagomonas_calceolata.AAC.6
MGAKVIGTTSTVEKIQTAKVGQKSIKRYCDLLIDRDEKIVYLHSFGLTSLTSGAGIHALKECGAQEMILHTKQNILDETSYRVSKGVEVHVKKTVQLATRAWMRCLTVLVSEVVSGQNWQAKANGYSRRHRENFRIALRCTFRSWIEANKNVVGCQWEDQDAIAAFLLGSHLRPRALKNDKGKYRSSFT